VSVVTHFPTNQDLEPARLREAFGIFPTGVVAVAAKVDGQLTGLDPAHELPVVDVLGAVPVQHPVCRRFRRRRPHHVDSTDVAARSKALVEQCCATRAPATCRGPHSPRNWRTASHRCSQPHM